MVSLSMLKFFGGSHLFHAFCMLFYIYIFLWPENVQSCCLLLSMILHLVYCLQTLCQLVYDQYGYWFCHPGVSRFVCEFLYVGTRLKTPPYFLLLQNPQVSVLYHLCLKVGYVFLSILGKFPLALILELKFPISTLTHCGRVMQICVFNTVKLGTSASSP